LQNYRKKVGFSFVEDTCLWIIFIVLSINAKFQSELGRYHSSSVYILLQPAYYSKLTVNQKKSPLSIPNGNCKNLHEGVKFLKSSS